MRPLIFRRTTLVWIFLTVATAGSWWIGTSSAPVAARDSLAWASAVVLLLAFVKVRLVLLHFMDVRAAPRSLRLLCDIWIACVAGALIGLHLQSVGVV